MIMKALTLLLLCTTLGSSLLALHYQEALLSLQQKQIRSVSIAKRLRDFSSRLRIATYPSVCDEKSKKILGEHCDLGNYMEWAGPHLETEARVLLKVLQENTDR